MICCIVVSIYLSIAISSRISTLKYQDELYPYHSLILSLMQVRYSVTRHRHRTDTFVVISVLSNHIISRSHLHPSTDIITIDYMVKRTRD